MPDIYFDRQGVAYNGGPIYACPGCGSSVYEGLRSGRIYNAGSRPVLSNHHTCGTPPLIPFAGTNEPDIPFEEPEEGGQLPNTEGWRNGLTLPDGVDWYAVPASSTANATVTVDARAENYPEVVRDLRAWVQEQNLGCEILTVRDRWVENVYVRRPAYFTLVPEGNTVESSGYSFEEDFACLLCGETHLAYTVSCAAGIQNCSMCGFGGSVTNSRMVLVDGRLVCTSCVHPCEEEGCEENTQRNRRFCEEHGQYAYCARCEYGMEARAGEDVPWVSRGAYTALCESCVSSLCERCNRFTDHDLVYVSDFGQDVCPRCAQAALYGSNEEEFDEEATLNARRLRIPVIEGRENVRSCGVEIEGANGSGDADTLAEAFYSAELCEFDEVVGYHYGTGQFAHVERDSSVDWEAVIGPFNPAVQSEVTQLNRAVRTIRDLVHNGTLGLDLRAGLHIHVGAERVSLDGAYNLNVLFGYLEDVIFRLGAARWPIHRAVANTHYTQPIPKDLRKLEFARQHGDENSRYYALSFNNYFRSMLRHCQCGAVRYDSWEDCTCDLGKCTFEFRVFNTTANPRKLHAYLALCQALVAKALQIGRINSEEFAPLDFVTRRFKDMEPILQEELTEAWAGRLRWMFNELPLTDNEKESLIYCVKHSELSAIGGEIINELSPVEEAEEVFA